MSTDVSGFRAAIRDIRTGLGWSQRELARRVGVSASTVKRIEDGTINPRIVTLDAIAEALGGRGDYVIVAPGAQ